MVNIGYFYKQTDGRRTDAVAQQTIDILPTKHDKHIKRKSCLDAVDCYHIGFMKAKYSNIGFRSLVHLMDDFSAAYVTN
jgi:hypothetical protein